MINVCVPVLKRYGLLHELLLSSGAADAVWIVNNGRDGDRLESAIRGTVDVPVRVFTPRVPLGVAASWNWFILNVPEERVIVNDDVTFAEGSLKKLVASDADIVWAKGQGFSCFVLRDSCRRKIGLFDEKISPGYAYYEDDDYLQRIDGKGTRAPSVKTADIACDIQHARSSTLRVNTPEEWEEHHRRFKIAQQNYAKKWGLEDQFVQEELRKGLMILV